MQSGIPMPGPAADQISTCAPSSISRLPGNLEERRGRQRIARQEREQLVAPQRHAGTARVGHDALARQEEGGVHQVERQALARALRQRQRDVRILGEAEAQFAGVEARRPSRSVSWMRSSGVGHRRLQHLHRQQHVALVQHLVVLEVVQQRVRHRVLVGGEEHRRARHPQRRVLGHVLDERRQRQPALLDLAHHQLAAAAPGGHHARTPPGPAPAGTSRRRESSACWRRRSSGRRSAAPRASTITTAPAPAPHARAPRSAPAAVSIAMVPVTAMP